MQSTEAIESTEVESKNDLVVKRYVYSNFKTYFICVGKICKIKNTKLVLIIYCNFTNEEINTHKSPCIGDVVNDENGTRLKIIATENP